MIFFAVTKPRRKAILLAKILVLVLLVGLALPAFYGYLANAGALSYIAVTEEPAAEEEEMPGEPIRVMQPADSWLDQMNRLLLGGEVVVDLK